MPMNNTAEIFDNLVDHLGPFKDELAELLADAALGAKILNTDTKYLVTKLFGSMPESDNLTIEDIARNIRNIGTPFADEVARDIEYAGDELN